MGADVGARAGPVVRDHGLAPGLAQALRHHAPGDVHAAAGTDGDRHAHRFRRELLRARSGRDEKQQDGPSYSHDHLQSLTTKDAKGAKKSFTTKDTKDTKEYFSKNRQAF